VRNSYYVYILSNANGMLYTGVTNNLERRLDEHKRGEGSSYASKFKIGRLVYCEEFQSRNEAIEAEKRIKGWTRKKKLDLIRQTNPEFVDLSQDGPDA
jgi:putative endonuclease